MPGDRSGGLEGLLQIVPGTCRAMPGDPPDPSAVNGTPLWNSGFEVLIKQAREAHNLEVERLRQEVKVLRKELGASGPKQATMVSADGEDLSLGCGGSPVNGAPQHPCSPESPSEAAEEARRISNGNGCSKENHLSGSIDGGDRIMTIVSTSSRDLAARDSSRRTSGSETMQERTNSKGRGLEGSLKRRRTKEIIAQQRGCLWKLVNKPSFEVFVALAIITNGMVMALEAQYAGFSLAEDTKHRSAQGQSEEVWPKAEEAFDILNVIFGVFFLFEVALKIVALKMEFVHETWNWIDLAIALMWLVNETIKKQMNAQFLRLARLARLVRLLRLARFVQSRGMDSLFLLSTALRGSVATVTWAFATLLAIHVMLALFLNGIIREIHFDKSGTADQAEVYAYFGSFSRSFLTAFEITLANWPAPIRVLVDNVSEIFIIYAVLHKIVFGFAVIGVINAVFIQETFKAAQMDDSIMVRQTMQKERTHCEKMGRLFVEADDNGDGAIDSEEWEAVCKDDWVQLWLRSQDIKTRDAATLFEWLDNGDGRLTAEELIQGTAALKGPSAVMNILSRIHELERSVTRFRGDVLGLPASEKATEIT